MIPWLNVKGSWKQPSVIYGKANGVWHDLGGVNNEPYNEALALVGLDKVDSLSVILTDSAMCEALAGNAEAYGIMKENYSADMENAIDSNYTPSLNLLNYRCKLKCYVYKYGQDTGGVGASSFSCYRGKGSITKNSDGSTSLQITEWGETTFGIKVDCTGFATAMFDVNTNGKWGYGVYDASSCLDITVATSGNTRSLTNSQKEVILGTAWYDTYASAMKINAICIY